MIRMNVQIMEAVKEFKYLGLILYKRENMAGDKRKSFAGQESSGIIRAKAKRNSSKHSSIA